MSPPGEPVVGRWSACAASERGLGHVRRDEPREDAVHGGTAGGWTFVAIADGHGSPRCPRAAAGARYAVDVVADVLTSIDPDSEYSAVAEGLGRVPGQLHDAWRDAVSEGVGAIPLSGEEVALVGANGGDDAARAHGTTLVLAAASRRWLLLAQLGDGDLLYMRHDSPIAHRPLPTSTKSVPNMTDSLSQPDAAKRMRCHLVDLEREPVAVVFLATDGFGNAFESPDWHDSTAHQLMDEIRTVNDDDVAAALASWCSAPARVGGDDVSMGLLIDRALVPEPEAEGSTTDRELEIS